VRQRIPLNVRLDDLPLDRIVELLTQRVRNKRGVPDPELESLLADLDRRIRQALTERFGDKDFVGDAVDSVLGTLLRRIRDGEPLGVGGGGIADFLATVALDRAFESRLRLDRHLAFDPADSALAPPEEIMAEEAANCPERSRQIMQEKLDDLLAEMEPYLENRRHRAIFQILFNEAYGGTKRHNEEISLEVGCSLRTVERVRRDFRQRWLPRVEEARQALWDKLAQTE
jgi:hypothetical protein